MGGDREMTPDQEVRSSLADEAVVEASRVPDQLLGLLTLAIKHPSGAQTQWWRRIAPVGIAIVPGSFHADVDRRGNSMREEVVALCQAAHDAELRARAEASRWPTGTPSNGKPCSRSPMGFRPDYDGRVVIETNVALGHRDLMRAVEAIITAYREADGELATEAARQARQPNRCDLRRHDDAYGRVRKFRNSPAQLVCWYAVLGESRGDAERRIRLERMRDGRHALTGEPLVGPKAAVMREAAKMKLDGAEDEQIAGRFDKDRKTIVRWFNGRTH